MWATCSFVIYSISLFVLVVFQTVGGLATSDLSLAVIFLLPR